METFLADLRYALRTMRRNLGFTAIALAALALGIGANTAIFTVVDAVLLQPLPYPQPDRIMKVGRQFRTGVGYSNSIPKYMAWRQNDVFDAMALYDFGALAMNVGSGNPPQTVKGLHVSGDYFKVFGVSPAVGRTFSHSEDLPNGPAVAVISYAVSQSRLGGTNEVLGRPILLNSVPYTVVGILPRGFQPDPEADVWLPLQAEPNSTNQGHYLNVAGRLKPGVTVAGAQAQMKIVGEQFRKANPKWMDPEEGVAVVPMRDATTGEVRTALLVLFGAVALVLLIACANVANLLLARAAGRQRELAIRSAVGANRGRVVRQLLTESVLLSLVGGGVGLLLAVWWSDLLVALGKDDIPRAVQVGLDWRVLSFTLSVSVLTGLIFGLVPAFQSSRTELTDSLKEGRGVGGGARRNRMRSVLVVSELAIAVVLLVGAGLLIQSLWRLQRIKPGLEPKNILTFNVALPDTKYDGEKQSQFFQQLRARLQTLPGVQSASAVLPLPLSGERFSISFEIDGRPVAKKDEPSADVFIADVGYFKTMGIPIIRGRDFDEHDQHKSTPVIIVSEAFAKQFFPGEEAIGKHIKPGLATFDNEKAPMREIVGVVGDVRNRGLSVEPKPAYYEPETQVPFNQLVGVIKTEGDPHSLITAVTREVGSIDKDLPVFDVKTMDEYIASSVAAPRFNTTLLTIFAAVALVLTIVGLYGVMSYAVAQRTNEIGIRLALGAQTRDVLTLVVKQGALLIAIGLVIGLIGAFAAMRVVQSLLFGVTTKDPMTFISAAVVLAVIGLLACYLPARRATKVDPIEALRRE